MAAIDVSHCEELIELNVTLNDIEELDVSQNVELLVLECNNNPLQKIDVSNSLWMNLLVLSEEQIKEGGIQYSNPRMRIKAVPPMKRQGNRRFASVSRDEYVLFQSEMKPYIEAIFEKNFPDLNPSKYLNQYGE